MKKGKWRRPEDHIESKLEEKFWSYLFRILLITGTISGTINTLVNLLAINAGKVTYPAESGILYYPYSFLGGFALGTLLSLWILIILLAVVEIIWLISSFNQFIRAKLSSKEINQNLL